MTRLRGSLLAEPIFCFLFNLFATFCNEPIFLFLLNWFATFCKEMMKNCPAQGNSSRSANCTKNLIYTKFTQCKYGAKKCKLLLMYDNNVFALEFATPCKLECKCGIYPLAFDFLLVSTFLHYIFPEQICVNPIFRAAVTLQLRATFLQIKGA